MSYGFVLFFETVSLLCFLPFLSPAAPCGPWAQRGGLNACPQPLKCQPTPVHTLYQGQLLTHNTRTVSPAAPTPPRAPSAPRCPSASAPWCRTLLALLPYLTHSTLPTSKPLNRQAQPALPSHLLPTTQRSPGLSSPAPQQPCCDIAGACSPGQCWTQGQHTPAAPA